MAQLIKLIKLYKDGDEAVVEEGSSAYKEFTASGWKETKAKAKATPKKAPAKKEKVNGSNN
tara:strand:- start:352 stop:534 length:183 start_codon:yes stop_codon:yes gene_type:complete